MTDFNQGTNIGINYYEQAQAHYNRIKPIRGARASQNIRPMANRGRTWERVVERERDDGVWYGYQLYETDVIMISPTGIIEFFVGSWQSTASAQFIEWVGRAFFRREFTGYKRNNKIWVLDGHSRDGKPYPIGKDRVQFKVLGTESGRMKLEPVGVIEEIKPVIDRKKMKEAMSIYKPMLNYMSMVLKLTGGLLTHDMRKSLVGRVDNETSWRPDIIYICSTGDEITEMQYGRSFYGDTMQTRIDNIAINGTPDDWMKVLCAVAHTFDHTKETIGHEDCIVKWGTKPEESRASTRPMYDLQLLVKPSAVQDKFARYVKTTREDVWTSKVVNHGL
jgi:hypothetical protein